MTSIFTIKTANLVPKRSIVGSIEDTDQGSTRNPSIVVYARPKPLLPHPDAEVERLTLWNGDEELNLLVDSYDVRLAPSLPSPHPPGLDSDGFCLIHPNSAIRSIF